MHSSKAKDPCQDTQSLTFAVCTDVHQDIMHDGPRRLQTFVDAAVAAQADMAIQLGDFCQPTEANLPFLDIWRSLRLPRYSVLGNHDMDGGASREQTVAYMSMPGRFYSFDINGWHGVVLDGNDPSQPPREGYPSGVASDQIDWLRADLRDTTLPVLVFIHQSLDRGAVDGDEDVLSLLSEVNQDAGWPQVVAVFSGHHHLDYDTCVDGIWHVQVNSMSNLWMGDDYKRVRYSDAIDEAHPYIKYTAPYRDPLYAIVHVEPGGAIRIDGVESQWVGPSPEEVGFLHDDRGAELPLAGASVRPGVASRVLPPKPPREDSAGGRRPAT
jgi:3',5'-cyclic AMP phosphodiesterase CpdA